MKKKISLTLLLLLTACSTTIVYAPKHICNHGADAAINISGSDLKGNALEQSSQGNFSLGDAIKKALGF